MIRLGWGSASDVGRARQANEDFLFTAEGLYIVADGMGGHQGGAVASELAVSSLRTYLQDMGVLTTDSLVQAVQLANEAVVSAASDDPELAGMGTTLCAIAVVHAAEEDLDRLAIVNVGDSRVYLLKGGLLEQVTDDHSLVASLERQGRLTRAEAAVHPQRNIITRALGIDARVMVDSWEVVPVAGDRDVLCSDGLFNEVDESRIAATLRRLADPTDAAGELVRLANEGGGRDNISVVIVDVLVGEGSEVADGSSERSDRVVAAVSGEARVAKGPGPEVDEAPVAPSEPSRSERRAAKRASRPPRPRRITWRLLLFVAAILGVLAVGAGAITYYGRHTYFVGFDNDSVAVFKGRPGGVLWIQPELIERTNLTRQTVPAGVVAEIDAGKVEPTLDDAHRYLANIDEQASTGDDAGSKTTQTTQTTATTTPPGN